MYVSKKIGKKSQMRGNNSRKVLRPVAALIVAGMSLLFENLAVAEERSGTLDVLTPNEIAEVLVSLNEPAIWAREGDCRMDRIQFKNFHRGTPATLDVMTAFNLATMTPWFDLKIIDTPVLKYYFFTHKFQPGTCVISYGGDYDECIMVLENKIEVVSKREVRLRQTSLRKVPFGTPEKGIREKVQECSFVKK